MLLHAIPLDANMTAAAALRRLAAYGLWLDPNEPNAKSWIDQRAKALKIAAGEIIRRSARKPEDFGTAIRRQLYTNIMWYARPAREVLNACLAAASDATLVRALDLHEDDSEPTLQPPGVVRGPHGEGWVLDTPSHEGVVLHGGTPVAVSLLPPETLLRATTRRGRDFDKGLPSFDVPVPRASTTRGAPPPPPPEPKPVELSLWPRIDAPKYVPAKIAFPVKVGFSAEQQAAVTGGRMTLRAPAGTKTIAVTVELIADGVDADAWSKPLSVAVDNPTAAEVTFMLTGREPAGPEPMQLTTLEIRYVIDGAVVGTASKPLAIGRASDATMLQVNESGNYGKPWLAQPTTASALSLQPDPRVADLTIELAKPDGDPTTGAYVCKLYSPHNITADKGPHKIHLGADAKTFARQIVDDMRTFNANELIDNLLRSNGSLVTEKLPPAAIDAVREVAAIVAPNPPAVLLVSAEPFVPWELALIDPPLDATRPPFLGAQALVGRWFRDGASASAPPSAAAAAAAALPVRVPKPPASPPGTIPVKNMAVMAGMYKAATGLRNLPMAEKEAQSLVTAYGPLALPLPASASALRLLLEAKLQRGFTEVGADAMHFAGHGDFDPAQPDSSVMFLSDGTPIRSLLFRSAKYGQDLLPFIFLNACMIGIGGEVLGDMGGFPGNCLRGGFGAVLGALWEVDDAVASAIALEFWKRALPNGAGGTGESVAAILRDLRARYVCEPGVAPISTYLAYTYYGHPRLTLQRA
jgi:hypothetical protein